MITAKQIILETEMIGGPHKDWKYRIEKNSSGKYKVQHEDVFGSWVDIKTNEFNSENEAKTWLIKYRNCK